MLPSTVQHHWSAVAEMLSGIAKLGWPLPLHCSHWPFGIQPYIAHNGPLGFRAGQPGFAQIDSILGSR